jgi:hypothetical protein
MAISGITATGTNAATAYAMGAIGFLRRSQISGGVANSGILLPTYTEGHEVFTIWNATNVAILIYPQGAGQIFTAAAGPTGGVAPYTLAANTIVTLWAFSVVDWVVH